MEIDSATIELLSRMAKVGAQGHAILAELHARYQAGGLPRPDNHFDNRTDGTGRTWAEAVAEYMAAATVTI